MKTEAHEPRHTHGAMAAQTVVRRPISGSPSSAKMATVKPHDPVSLVKAKLEGDDSEQDAAYKDTTRSKIS